MGILFSYMFVDNFWWVLFVAIHIIAWYCLPSSSPRFHRRREQNISTIKDVFFGLWTMQIHVQQDRVSCPYPWNWQGWQDRNLLKLNYFLSVVNLTFHLFLTTELWDPSYTNWIQIYTFWDSKFISMYWELILYVPSTIYYDYLKWLLIYLLTWILCTNCFEFKVTTYSVPFKLFFTLNWFSCTSWHHWLFDDQ